MWFKIPSLSLLNESYMLTMDCFLSVKKRKKFNYFSNQMTILSNQRIQEPG